MQALSTVFKGKFLAALHAAEHAAHVAARSGHHRRAAAQRTQALQRHDWVVYAKTPLAGPAAVLDYLSRYTHRTAIGNERIVALDEHGVRVRVRDHEQRGKRSLLIDGVQFIGRFLQHVLPSGFKRIRHYGLLAPAAKTERLAAARAALAMPAANPRAREDAAAFMRRVAAVEIGCCPSLPRGASDHRAVAGAAVRKRAARRPRRHRHVEDRREPAACRRLVHDPMPRMPQRNSRAHARAPASRNECEARAAHGRFPFTATPSAPLAEPADAARQRRPRRRPSIAPAPS